jgi:hypothetical protein
MHSCLQYVWNTVANKAAGFAPKESSSVKMEGFREDEGVARTDEMLQ